MIRLSILSKTTLEMRLVAVKYRFPPTDRKIAASLSEFHQHLKAKFDWRT
ncbi:hypothetical protein PEPS_04780 [Persicobacter psychrovividus]|uniref:Uncharacterized protein n=1 Tax=Persicobacter psychrovividus TaxID=387638 RepID=A0ABN6L9A9_9BACT|nr:hypothetical protein PEPS_04780 [Persicobacter psychrovividus]